MTLRKEEKVCSNRPMGEGVWPNRHITFIVAKSLIKQFILLLFTVYVRGGVG